MAIIFENQYQKVVKSTNNFVDNRTEVELDVYKNQETREFEKQYKDSASILCEKISNYLYNNMMQLVEKANKIKPIDEIDDPDEFYKEHPEIKEEADEIQAIQDEGLYLKDKLLQEKIDIRKLKYKDTWKELGLTKELCNRVEYLGTRTIGFDGILNNNLTDLYDAVKQRCHGEIKDC